MPVPEVLTAIGASVAIVKNIYGVATGIYTWIEEVKRIDKTVRDLGDEISLLRETLETCENLLGSDTVRHVACIHSGVTDEDELWYSLFATLQDCRITMESLEKVLKPLKNSGDVAILRKFKLDLKDNEITTIRQQIQFHSKRLQLSLQMVHLRVSCLGPTLITTSLDSRMDKLQSLIETQMSLLMELAKTASTTQKVDQRNFEVYARSFSRAAQSLLATSSSLYTGSQYEGSVVEDNELKLAIREWVTDVSLPDTEVTNTILGALPRSQVEGRTTSGQHVQHEMSPSELETSSLSRSGSLISLDSKNPYSRDPRAAFLYSKGINVNALTFNPTPHLKAIFIAYVKKKETPSEEMERAIELLLELGANPNALVTTEDLSWKDESWTNGLTLAHIASVAGWDTILSILLQHGLDPNVGDIKLLYCAARAGNTSMVQKLLAGGATISTKTDAQQGKSALHIAAERGHVDIARILIENGASVDDEVNNSFYPRLTPMLLAIQNNHVKMVEVLVELGAQLRPYQKITQLLYACKCGSEACVRVLLAIEAKSDVKNRNCDNALKAFAQHCSDIVIVRESDLLIAEKYRNIVQQLLEAGAKPSRSITNSITHNLKTFEKKVKKGEALLSQSK